MGQEVKETRKRRRGYARISAKNQITIPVEALRTSGLAAGEEVKVTRIGPGKILIEPAVDPLDALAGRFTGLYPPNYLEDLRNEWER